MKFDGLNPFSAGIGIVAGTLVGISFFVMTQMGESISTYYPIRLQSLQASPVQLDAFFESKKLEKDKSGLTQFLTNSAQDVEGRHLTIVELGRAEDVDKILTPVLDWQQQSTGTRDLIIYLAPTSPDRKAEKRMGETVKLLLRSRTIQFPLINRRTTYIFHSQLKNHGYSLQKIVDFAHEKKNFPQYGLMHIQLDGPIDHIAWIRTTLGRWSPLDKSYSAQYDISASLVDPSRNTLTSIDL